MPPSRVAPKPGEGGCGNPAERDESARALLVGAQGDPPLTRRRGEGGGANQPGDG